MSRWFAGRGVGCYANVTSTKMVQRISLKFLVKLKKIPPERLKLLKKVYREDMMSRTQIFEWHKRFKNGRKEAEDDSKSRRPSTSKTDHNTVRVKQLVRNDRNLTVRMIEEELGLNRKSVRKILLDDLAMHKVCAKIVPNTLSEEQKQR